jgi:SulP family sulfate permease
MELVAQGGANIASSLFGGIPATGAIARTATNIKNGGRTPVAGMIHAIVLLLIMVLFGPWAKLIPLSCLAGILVVIAYNMSEWHTFVSILKGPRSDVLVLLTTFLLTVFFDLTVAIEVGIVLAALLFMRNMAQISKVESITNQIMDIELIDESKPSEKIKKIDGVQIYEIQGPLFFGNVYHFKEILRRTHTNPKILILRMRYVSLIDASGLHYLKDVIKEFHAKGVQILLSEVQPHVLKELKAGSITSILEGKYSFGTIASALIHAQKILETPFN